MTDSTNKNSVSTGVQELIEQLKAQGVNSGREEAVSIIADAREEASRLIDQAKAEAEAIQKSAQQQADFTIKAGIEALQLAERDTVLELKEFLIEKFSQQITSLVSNALNSRELIKNIILEIAGNQKPGAGQPVEIILPERVIGIEELRRDPELIKHGRLLNLVMEGATDLLREDIEFSIASSDFSGIRFKLKQQAVEIDLSDEAVTAILLQHLQPRFRALLEGIVK
ncbi:hypothetical protein EOPP23_05195 [Endozoicomonas sp. OPT23]|uniref:hypothetical protein n=1 Tax=Endozoicomonas sp. OPT23 TaxID=2072845 RepID=UPI00129BB412|nr:hypothetical protein [Endozoicomonas sp. OPT23]MRI32378.1 hypothetical protein [Endozoicomonas sp. OPT23]